MKTSTDLAKVWELAVSNGEIHTVIRTHDGRDMEIGLLHPDNSGYYACDLATDRRIEARVEEKTIRGRSYNFRVLCNRYRALRPRRSTSQQNGTSGCPYCGESPNGLQNLKESVILYHFSLPNWVWHLYANAFVFHATGHFLLVPVHDGHTMHPSLPHYPQRMTYLHLEDLWEFYRNSEGLFVFFNSTEGGAASVDHFHVQVLCHDEDLPLEKVPVVRHGQYTILDDSYPARGLVFDRDEDVSRVHVITERLERANMSYNMLFLGNSVYVIPKSWPARTTTNPLFRADALGGIELAGKMITDNEDIYRQANYDNLATSLRTATLTYDELFAVLDAAPDLTLG